MYLRKSVDLSNQKDLQVNLADAIKCLKSVQEDLVVQTPSLTKLVTLPKTNQLDALKMSMELVIGSKQEGRKTPVNQTSAVVLKHAVQIMPGITKWIEVLVQEFLILGLILHHILLLIHRKCLSSVQNLVFHSILTLSLIR